MIHVSSFVFAFAQAAHAQYISEGELAKPLTAGALVRKFNGRSAVAGLLVTAAVLICEVRRSIGQLC